MRSFSRSVALALASVALLLAACSGSSPAAHTSTATTPVAPAPSTGATPAAALKPMRPGAIAPPSNGCYIGFFRPPGPFDRKAMASYSAVSAKPPAIIMWYQQWGTHGANKFDPAMVAAVYKRGAVPMISWEPWDPGSKPHNIKVPSDAPDWTLNSITAGKHDAFIHSWARSIKAMGGPVMLRPMHEMNGNWYPWSGTMNGNQPQDFVAAWRHMHDIFMQEGATNVTWVWSVNYVSKPFSIENTAAAYYPGDKYVDWVSASGFNWGQSITGVPWKSFDDIFTSPLLYLKSLGKPILIGECAAVEQGGSKPEWIKQTYAGLAANHPEIGAFIYYDAYEKGVKHGVQDWRIQSSKASAAAYRSAVSAPYMLGGPMPELAAWTKGLSAADKKRLASYPHLY